MSAHVLLDLLNELRKRDKVRGSQSSLSLLRNRFNKFNYTGACLSQDIKSTQKSYFLASIPSRFYHNVTKSVNH